MSRNSGNPSAETFEMESQRVPLPGKTERIISVKRLSRRETRETVASRLEHDDK